MTPRQLTMLLALASTSVAYLLYFRLLRELGATGGMTVIYVVPVFGVLWAALFLGEAIHLSTVAGGAVILVSVWLITRTPKPPNTRSLAARTKQLQSPGVTPGGTGPTARMAVSKTAGWGSIPWSPA